MLRWLKVKCWQKTPKLSYLIFTDIDTNRKTIPSAFIMACDSARDSFCAQQLKVTVSVEFEVDGEELEASQVEELCTREKKKLKNLVEKKSKKNKFLICPCLSASCFVEPCLIGGGNCLLRNMCSKYNGIVFVFFRFFFKFSVRFRTLFNGGLVSTS